MRTVLLLIGATLFALAARADVVSPEQSVCSGKKAGDACTTCEGDLKQAACGTCTAPPPSCNAGACRRHPDEKACLAEAGCSWGPGQLYCAGTSCECPQTPPAPDDPLVPLDPEKPKASSCATGMPMAASAAALALLLTARERRRTREGARRSRRGPLS